VTDYVDVLVAGAGLVGLALAPQAVRHGTDVRVVEELEAARSARPIPAACVSMSVPVRTEPRSVLDPG
jgi:2-polyprenyl-6-methoxyphenol hydroxylase-like FAD-dependent oxidoreductase